MITIEIISEANAKLGELLVTHWLNQEVLSLRWWGIVGFLLFSYILCFKLLDKKRLTELLLYGSLVSVVSVVCDIVVSNFNLLLYKVSLFPIIPSIFVYDITALPLFFMLIYQYTNSFKTFSIWIILASALMGFVFTPLIVMMGYLEFINWSYLNAFLIIAFIGFFAKAGIALILYIQEKAIKTQ